MKTVIITLMALVLTACVSSPEELAEQGDWYQIGYHDGITGHVSRSYQDLTKLGSANSSDYDRGYLEGVTEYCNPNTAYQIGLSGQYYEGVCEGTEQAQRFRMEWQRGWNDYSN